MLGNLAVFAFASLLSVGSYAFASQPEVVSPLPITKPSPTPTPTSTPTPTATPTPTNTPTPTPTYTPTPAPITTSSDLETLFTKYAGEYSVDKDLLKRIASCESGYNPQAENGDYVGMFQFATSSWIATRTHMGEDTNPELRKNTEEAIKTTAFKISTSGANAWPSCQ